MKHKQSIMKIKRGMSWGELVATLKVLRKDPEFMAALRQFIKKTTS